MILELDEAVAWREVARERGKIVVFTNGCFDVLHAGHVEYLRWAREQGDLLIVGLNTDASVRRLKGARRPIVPFEERAEIIAGLRSVDAVVGFSQRTPETLIDRIKPDVHVKSEQYREDELPERDVVLANGGRIALAPHSDGKSTTDVIARIIERYAANPDLCE
ncbi:MAG: D-glycero-beta-D-manno-heptose 1-phosphate adenylyltransferase [Candidatus Eremiobacteraeota bacterium]|nr:D-glycero-beta-D-manno-heptose 1-phosphate adenylyltransferase [Candidatus Eremiobacteraeota bacterium]